MRTLLPAATKLGQGNVFTGVCDSVHRGGVCLSACWDATPAPGADTPPWTRHPQDQTPTHPWDQIPPSWDQMPPRADTPPGKHTPAYGQRAAGTHPTGMHSCWCLFPEVNLRRSDFRLFTVGLKPNILTAINYVCSNSV